MENIVSFCKDWFQEYKLENTYLNLILWIFWAIWVLLILIAVSRVIKFRLQLRKEIKVWGDGSGPQKQAVVIVPIKGVTPSHTSDFFQSLLDQNYDKYRLIVTVESNDDPAAEWLSDQFNITLSNPVWAPQDASNGLQSVQLVVAGKCKGRGQKVHNQLAAFNELTPEDQILAFVDADIVCPPDWLAKLTAPINRGTHDPATTYRWLIPEKRKPGSLFASVINASVTTQGGNVRENMPWGGSMALSRAAFDDLNVPALFEGSVNDDLRLGKAAKKAGYKVGYIRNLIRPTRIDFNVFKFFEFARRQYLQVKIFAPILYTGSNFILGTYFLGFVSIVAAIIFGGSIIEPSGEPSKIALWAWVPLIIATILDQIRAATRESIYRNLFGDDKETYKRIKRTSFIEHCLTPVYMAVHGLIVLSTWFMTKMEWGGIQYQVEGVNKTRVLGRKNVEAVKHASVGELVLPVGAAFSGIAAISAAGFANSVANEVETETTDLETDAGTVTIEDTGPIQVADTEVETEAESTEERVVDATEPISPALAHELDTETAEPEAEEASETTSWDESDDNSALGVGVAAAAVAGAATLLADDDNEVESGVVEDETEVVVEDETEVAVEDEAEVAVENEAEIAVEDEAEVAVENEAEIAVEDEAEVAVEDETEVAVEDETLVAADAADESEEKTFTFQKLAPVAAAGAAAIAGAVISGSDDDSEAEEKEPGTIETAILAVSSAKPMPDGATEFFVDPKAIAAPAEETIETAADEIDSSEVETAAEESNLQPAVAATAVAAGAATWVNSIGDNQSVAATRASSSGEAIWVDESEVESNPTAPSQNGAHPAPVQTQSAVHKTRLQRSTAAPAKTKFLQQGRDRYKSINRKAGQGRLYLAKWEQLSRHQLARLKRRK